MKEKLSWLLEGRELLPTGHNTHWTLSRKMKKLKFKPNLETDKYKQGGLCALQ